MRVLLQKLLPVEQAAVFAGLVALLLCNAFGLSLYLPDTHSSAFALEHYLTAIALATLLLAFLHWRQDRALPGTQLLLLLREMFAMTLIVFLHFNFKLWAQLANPNRYDTLYATIDQALSPLVLGIDFLNLGFAPLKAILPNAYHDVFIAMFLVTFLCLAAVRRISAFRQCLLAVAWVLVLGGLAYFPAPALGPFVFTLDIDSHAGRIQQDMLGFMQTFLASGGRDYAGGNFIMPLAAMPSLHIAHAFVLLYYAWRNLRWLGYAYLPLFFFLFSEAIASGWHYLIDLPAGLLLALLCINLARWQMRVSR